MPRGQNVPAVFDPHEKNIAIDIPMLSQKHVIMNVRVVGVELLV